MYILVEPNQLLNSTCMSLIAPVMKKDSTHLSTQSERHYFSYFSAPGPRKILTNPYNVNINKGPSSPYRVIEPVR